MKNHELSIPLAALSSPLGEDFRSSIEPPLLTPRLRAPIQINGFLFVYRPVSTNHRPSSSRILMSFSSRPPPFLIKIAPTVSTDIVDVFVEEKMKKLKKVMVNHERRIGFLFEFFFFKFWNFVICNCIFLWIVIDIFITEIYIYIYIFCIYWIVLIEFDFKQITDLSIWDLNNDMHGIDNL